MMVYLALLGLELICSLTISQNTGRNKWLLRISILVLFILSALKSTAVGIDTEGYASVYLRADKPCLVGF